MIGKIPLNKYQKILQYRPLYNTLNFFLAVDNNTTAKFLYFKKTNKILYLLRLHPKQHIPKTGLLLSSIVQKFVKQKTILDIGTGDAGIIAIHAAKHNAKRVVACDIRRGAINEAHRNAQINGLNKIKWIVSNLFQNIAGKFDIIIGNLPQLPMNKKLTYDSGGFDGRMYIERVIEQAPKYLNKNGKLVLLIFDFLGVNKQFGNKEPLFNLLQKVGFEARIVATRKRIIREGGKTKKSLNRIKKAYPKYIFKKDKSGNLHHKVFVIIATLRNYHRNSSKIPKG